MKLPNGDRAVVSDEKLYGDVLNSRHELGRDHACLFSSLLGIDRAHAERLRDALLKTAVEESATPGKPSSFGRKYEVRFRMSGPVGVYTVLSIWVIGRG